MSRRQPKRRSRGKPGGPKPTPAGDVPTAPASEGEPPTQKALAELAALREVIDGFPQDVVTNHQPVISHAASYQGDIARLLRYGQDSVFVRTAQYSIITTTHLYNLLDMYLYGVRARNPFPIYASARSLIEIYASAASVRRTIDANKGNTTDRLYERIVAVEEALIRSTSGTRNNDVVARLRLVSGGSRLRQMTDADVARISAVNVLTRVEQLDKNELPGALALYNELCEFIHPNLGLNWMYFLLGDDPGTITISRGRTEIIDRATALTACLVAQMAKALLDICNSMPAPFGDHLRLERRLAGLGSVPLLERLLATKSIPGPLVESAREAALVNADEVSEHYFARDTRENWEVANLKPIASQKAAIWIEMKRPSEIVSVIGRSAAEPLPQRWGCIYLPLPIDMLPNLLGGIKGPWARAREDALKANAAFAALADLWIVDQRRRPSEVALGSWLLLHDQSQLLVTPPMLVSVRPGERPEAVLKEGYPYLLPILVALSRLGEQHVEMRPKANVLLTVPEGWTPYVSGQPLN